MSEATRNIPIHNIYYILCYAWDILKAKDIVKVSNEKFNDIYDLLSRVFDMALRKMIRAGVVRSYVDETDAISTVRGRIEINESIKPACSSKKLLVCSYDEYSVDNAFNQIINFTLELLIRNEQVNKETKKSLKSARVFFSGIGMMPPTKENCQKLIYSRNTVHYKLLISIAIMLYQGTVVNEDDGKTVFSNFFEGDQMGRVFQAFLRNFYYSHLNRKDYQVYASNIAWPYEEEDNSVWKDIFEINRDLGDRQTDVVIDFKKYNFQLIIEAKFYKNTFINARNNSEDIRLRTQHLNQIRGYIEDSKFVGAKVGSLIYPLTTHDYSEGSLKPVKGANIILKTVNLNTDWADIESDLLGFINKIEAGAARLQENV